jgi:phytoene dehydrogenase-like protein
LPLTDFGLEWIQPEFPLAHPLDGADGRSVVVARRLDETSHALGRDARAYERLIGGFVRRWQDLLHEVLEPIHLPHHPKLMARFGWHALKSAQSLALHEFSEPATRALVAGMAGHSLLPLESRPSAAFFLLLAVLAHAVGWPLPRGGSQRIADALAGQLRALGGRVITGVEIHSTRELPESRAVIFDVTPSQLLKLAGDQLPEPYRRRLRQYRHGPGVFKIDWALSAPIPWADPRCSRAGTLHIGGNFDAIAEAERAVAAGIHPEKPFVILAQPSLFDRSRAPAGAHTAWAYCHVPNGSREDMTERIERQIERFAPGFSSRIRARHVLTAAGMQAYNPNYIGGDITAGLQTIRQTLARPTLSRWPYRTPAPGLYLCSAATPPGPGVHGMCGYHAARAVLEDIRIV